MNSAQPQHEPSPEENPHAVAISRPRIRVVPHQRIIAHRAALAAAALRRRSPPPARRRLRRRPLPVRRQPLPGLSGLPRSRRPSRPRRRRWKRCAGPTRRLDGRDRAPRGRLSPLRRCHPLDGAGGMERAICDAARRSCPPARSARDFFETQLPALSRGQRRRQRAGPRSPATTSRCCAAAAGASGRYRYPLYARARRSADRRSGRRQSRV